MKRVKRRKNINYNTSVFTNEDALSFYLLGVFCTDGCVYKPKGRNKYVASLSSVDRTWLAKIARNFSKEIRLCKTKNTNTFVIRIHNQDICNWLMSYECKPRKTYTLKFPTIPNRYLPDFIRG